MQRIINKTFNLLGKFNFACFKYALAVILFFGLNSELYAQLPVFNLNVVKTDETCLGNGTLAFSVQGINPLALLTYRVYKLPDLNNAVSMTNPTVGLQSGTYRVVALQTLDALFNTQFFDIVINNNIISLDFEVTSVSAGCGDNGTMTIAVTTGVGVTYEIISGPMIVPPQSSPVFSAMPPGIYGIRVFDECGAGSVKTHTLVSGAPAINISQLSFAAQFPSCNTILSSMTLTPTSGTVLTYPLQIVYTITPPDGTPVVTYNQNLSNGPENALSLPKELPFYHDQSYTVSISVTDGCGTTFTHNQTVNEKLRISLSSQPALCGTYFLQARLLLYKANYTLQFTSFPPGFDPNTFNSSHPTFGAATVLYGSSTTPVPFGYYAIQVTDACGNTATSEITLEDIDPVPAVSVTPHVGCNSFNSKVQISVSAHILMTAVITAAPVGYPAPLPHTVTAMINAQGKLIIDPLLTGNYTILLTDTCGNIYDPVNFYVPPMATQVATSILPDCTSAGLGSIKLSGVGTQLISVILTEAPAGFATPLPYNVSSFISSGVFTMSGLPLGAYKFKVVDNCNFENIVSKTVTGYLVTQDDLLITPHCGAFDLTLTHVSNSGQHLFWLQRYNDITGNWEHPATFVPYIENSMPTSASAIPISANTMTLNLLFTGRFRILKSFESYVNGNVGQTKNCLEILREFTFDGQFEITGINKITCGGNRADVEILTNGVAPFIFKIIKKNGVPFVIDNGNDNIFVDLEPALYNFTVQHSCGDIIPGSFDVSELPAAVIAHKPPDLFVCDADGMAEFDLSTQTAAILNTQEVAGVTISYHISAHDAVNAANAIQNLQNYLSSGNQTIYVRLLHNTSRCFDTTDFDLIVRPYPTLQMNKEWGICNESTVTITADPGYQYLWSTNETTRSITVDTPGIYTVTVSSMYPDGSCSSTLDIEVLPIPAPDIIDIKTIDWTDNDNIIEVILSNNSDYYLFSLDNVTFQQSNIFSGLAAGIYTVYVKDRFGCGSAEKKLFLLNYPKFFTPNGDGVNDTWKIKYSELEPNLKTYIYDRYGKLITGFLPGSNGWDGTLNGYQLPSTDYWFVVQRQDGTVFKGHFSMKR